MTAKLRSKTDRYQRVYQLHVCATQRFSTISLYRSDHATSHVMPYVYAADSHQIQKISADQRKNKQMNEHKAESATSPFLPLPPLSYFLSYPVFYTSYVQ